jgi:hypothetical protein
VFIAYSRYERLHPSAATPPAVGTHWYAAFAVDICGNVQPDLAGNPNSASNPGLHTLGDGVIRVEPTTSADAGNNATLARFVADYPGFGLTPTTLTLPGEKARTDGQKCPRQTPDAGKRGQVLIKVWPSSTAPGVNNPTTTTDPTSVKLAPPDGQLITIGFVPAGTSLPKPNATAITAMLQDISTAATPTTTAPLTTTTVPVTTTTPATTTTTPATTTTTKP